MITVREHVPTHVVGLLAVLAFVLCACEGDGSSMDSSMSAEERARIEAEVRQALDDYAAAAVSDDQESVKAFWGDFDDFIHAGDGRVMGSRETWLAWMDANQPDDTISWEFSDVHVAVLGPNAASYTANFEVVNVTDGVELTTTGSWTYVLRKTGDGWRVVQSNGKHNEFSYYN